MIKSFFTLAHTIIVAAAVVRNCYQHQAVVVTKPSGYISNNHVGIDNVGSNACPWRIEAPKGNILMKVCDIQTDLTIISNYTLVITCNTFLILSMLVK